MAKPKVINTTSKTLNEYGKHVLLLYGLKFTPVPKTNLIELRTDLRKFCRKLRLIEFFADKPNSKDDSIVKPESKFSPNRNRDIILDTYIDFLLKYPLEEKTEEIKKKPNNLNKKEWDGLQMINNDKDLVIKQSDKGGACVVMDADFYLSKMLEILSDGNTYKLLGQNIDNKVFKNIEKLTNEHSDELTKHEIGFLTNPNYKTSQLYGLPKVHKSKLINHKLKSSTSEYLEITQPHDLSFRPIIAGPACVTSKLSEFLDLILKPYLSFIQSYVRDDIDFLDKIQRNVTASEALLTFDVVSMYTNIHNQLGKEAISYWVDNYPNELKRNISKNFIIKALSIVLEWNTFEFDGKSFLQLQGTAMGTKVAPTYATLVMGYLEIKLYEKIAEKYGINTRTNFIGKWRRYLDDCFIIWDTNIDTPKNLLTILQTLHKSIKFTMEESTNSISFLDIKVIIENNKIVTDLYQKPTDSQQYVHFKSCHPPHTKRNIPFNLARRTCTIVEENKSRDDKLGNLKIVLLKQGYPKSLIENSIEKAKNIPLEELRHPKEKQSAKEPLAFVSTHNPRNPDMFKIIKETISLLDASPKMKKALAKYKLINSKRQPKNLKQMLTRAKFIANQANPINDVDSFKVTKCQNKRCGTCPLLLETSTIKFKNTDEIFNIKTKMDCSIKDTIYLIKCAGCDKEYIGETSDLRSRVRVHKQQISDPRLRHLYVSHHIAHCSINHPIPFTITPFFSVNRNDRIYREELEQHFINKFAPELNRDSRTNNK